MTKEERQQIGTLIEELETIQGEAPTKTTYAMGRTSSSISSRILDVIRRMKEIVGDGEKESA